MQPYLFASSETKAIMRISDCELMHMRIAKQLHYVKRGNAFFYELPEGHTVLQHTTGKKLINWYKDKHPVDIDNEPSSTQTIKALELLLAEVLLPLQRKYKNKVQITYGFTSPALKRHISKTSPNGTAPDIDQHAACEVNTAGSLICNRGGAACDVLVAGTPMNEVTRFIVCNLNYDRVYYYGADRPLHVSCSVQPAMHLQIMKESENGRRYPARKAFANDAIKLAETL
jgi:hypothetical protein